MKIYLKRIVSLFLVLLLISFNIAGAYAAQGQASPYVTLKFGSRGSEVSKLQQALNNKGFSAGAVDGIYGPKTEKSVINFQKANKITIDGIAGKQTQSLLYAVSATRETTLSRNTSSVDIYWLSRIIEAEAGAEPYNGKVSVGNVILNRVISSDFPNTVKEVIFEDYKGIPQFSPVAEGTIYNTPSQASVNAANDALNGVRPVGSATYFFNPDKAEGKWIVNNKAYVMRIGNHVFYK
ncbi:cell wall hydrolase [Brassicibacter mesophilus]|uniref:cell wall hydrolase n=1 Tax=Brassicibacter mesophilus TaxID=745119 RepID=UPI003D1DB8F4